MAFSTEKDNLDSIQSRKWLLTINNPLEHGYSHEKIQSIMASVKGASLYWCMCDEEGDECETLHTHIFLFRTSPFSAKTLSNLFPNMHRDRAYGTAQETLLDCLLLILLALILMLILLIMMALVQITLLVLIGFGCPVLLFSL